MKKWIKWGLIIFVIIILLLIINFFRPRHNSETDQWCFRKGGYCVYNTPSGMLFTSPRDNLWYGKLSVQLNPENDSEILSEYLVRDDSSKRLSEVFGGDYNSYTCKNTGEHPKIIEYFYDFCDGMYGKFGCWHDRRAIVCGDFYYVNDFTSSYGPRYYGPFKIGEKPKIIKEFLGDHFKKCVAELESNRLRPAKEEPLLAIRYDKYDSPWIKNSKGLWEGVVGVYFTQYRHDDVSKDLPIGTILNETLDNGKFCTWKKTSEITWKGFCRQQKNETSKKIDKFPGGISGPINKSSCDLDFLDVTKNFSLS